MGRYSAFAAGFGGAGGGDGVHNGGQDAPEYGVTSRKGFKAKGIVQMVRRARRDENGLVKRTVKNLMKMKLLKKLACFEYTGRNVCFGARVLSDDKQYLFY